MKNNKILLPFIAAGGFIFNAIFWHEQLAFNALLFDAFILSCLFFLYRPALANTVVRYLLPAHLVALFALIVFNSILSKIAFAGTLLLLCAFVSYAHRSIWFAAGSLLLSFTSFAGGFIRLAGNGRKDGQIKKPLTRFIRFAIFPLLAGILFFIIYSGANNVFATIAGKIGSTLQHALSSFFGMFSFERSLFVLFGFYFTGALLLRAGYTQFELMESAATDNMKRIRKKRMDIKNSLLYYFTVGIMGTLAKGAMALKNEYRTGLISLALLNLLLLVINLIDINYLWIHFNYTPDIDLYTMIHEGTDLLILSIVMAILVVLIFFRGNLNFYRKNKWLKMGTYAWLLQNGVLVISVLLRDYYYIREFGLAYKRIGVLFFLLMVIAGLITVFLKVRWAKTNYYLLRVNAWCGIFLLVAASAIQWDVLIAKYNINHRQTAPLNLPFLLTLSDKVLPVLDANSAVLKVREKELNAKGIYMDRDGGSFENVLSLKIRSYLEEQDKYSWLSWNSTDASVKDYFIKKQIPIAVISK